MAAVKRKLSGVKNVKENGKRRKDGENARGLRIKVSGEKCTITGRGGSHVINQGGERRLPPRPHVMGLGLRGTGLTGVVGETVGGRLLGEEEQTGKKA